MSSGNCKYCPKCNTIKQYTSFHSNKARYDKLCNYCKDCNSKYHKELLSDPDKRQKQRVRTRDRYWKDPEVQKWSETYRLYGFTKENYTEKLKEQNNACAICKNQNLTKGRSYFSIDHCHTGGKVRGLLCDFCNWGLGNFHDNISRLESAIDYLKKFKSAI